jgi:hypothetical protein
MTSQPSCDEFEEGEHSGILSSGGTQGLALGADSPAFV